MSNYEDLITGSGTEDGEFYHGYAFEFADVSATMSLDPSFSIALEDQLVADVSAVAVLPDISASSLDGFITLKTDSRTPENPEAATFDLDTSILYAALSNNQSTTQPALLYSDAEVEFQSINSVATSNQIKHDVVRGLAFQITGGYGASDIFNNESALVADVVTINGTLNTAIAASLTSYINSKPYGATDIDVSGGTEPFDKVLKNLFTVVVNNTTRGTALLADLSANSTSGNLETDAPLKFAAGDVITFRVVYHPAVTTFATNGATINPRSYRVVLPLT